MDRKSEEYKKKKEEAADFLWKAIEEYVPNARNRVVPGTFQLGMIRHSIIVSRFLAFYELF
jgi:hypothetical protein